MEQAIDRPTDLTPSESPGFDVTILRLRELADGWPKVRGFLQAAVDYGLPMQAEALYAEALLGRTQIWMVSDSEGKVVGAAATMVNEYIGAYNALRVIALGGEQFGKWRSHIIACFDRFARGVDCKVLEAVGRRGWKRTLAPYGFEPKFVTYIKELK